MIVHRVIEQYEGVDFDNGKDHRSRFKDKKERYWP
jgi:hypothetical protein